jgi:hypothetical protein
MTDITYDFREGQLVRLYHGVPETAWTIYDTPDDVLRAAIAWNDPDGDFDDLARVHMLEIFLHDFIGDRP